MNGLILPIDKPAGWTSFDVVAKLRRGLKWKKVGHAGTLDPSATGLLIVLFGEMTRYSDEFMELGKSYSGAIRLGLTTDSDDLDGNIVSESEVQWNEESITSFLYSQVGEIAQKPPAVSAIQVAGVRSYKRVLKGHAIELAARQVRIDAIRVTSFRNPEIDFEMDCGKGTYVRSVARDLGEALGCGAVLASLRRTRIGGFHVRHAWAVGEALERPEFRGGEH
ncbi:MAG: tRNA pseudouridine(55) synthase TruB [Calditrichaeota bacterium]|nr:tRNA pseudouridine(55) synthase TruB [Calditrichota bacterium]MCB9366524.1 tRNA pseudouridine(55) synthase TruB [Calditrichota bacterium]MCB9391218.1 tRNA pseudouridine(55) synthase TruB [Calditrichota bacterium]